MVFLIPILLLLLISLFLVWVLFRELLFPVILIGRVVLLAAMWGSSSIRCLIGSVRTFRFVRLRLGSKPVSQPRQILPNSSSSHTSVPGLGVRDESDVHDEPFGSSSGRFTTVREAQSATLRDEVEMSGDRDDVQEPEEDVTESQRQRVGGRRRNTPYWFFLQCKRLVKGGKVGGGGDDPIVGVCNHVRRWRLWLPTSWCL